MTWNAWRGVPAAWDEMLLRFLDRTIYQSHGWGEHRSDFGWTAHRLTAVDNGRTISIAQALVRRYPPGVALAWVPGGPLGALKAWGAPFQAALAQSIGVRHLYCRTNALRDFADDDARVLANAGWRRPQHPMLSGESVGLDMHLEDDEWLKSIDRKHRYYVRKSAAAGLDWVHGNNETLRSDLAGVTRRLSEEKGMPLLDMDLRTLQSLGNRLPGAVLILIGYLGAEPVTGCLALVQQSKAFYATAATVGRGRDVSAAYFMVSRLRSLLRERNVREFDFGGIHASSTGSRGVDHFKQGFAQKTIRYLGEWDWATSAMLRSAASHLIGRRVREMR